VTAINKISEKPGKIEKEKVSTPSKAMANFNISHGGLIFQYKKNCWYIHGYTCTLCNTVFISKNRLQKHHANICIINTVSEE
jgi:hypothetical protein